MQGGGSVQGVEGVRRVYKQNGVAVVNNNNNNNNNNNETVQDALQMKGKAIKRLRGHKKKKKTIIPVSKNY